MSLGERTFGEEQFKHFVVTLAEDGKRLIVKPIPISRRVEVAVIETKVGQRVIVQLKERETKLLRDYYEPSRR